MKDISKGYTDLLTYQIYIGSLSMKFDSRIPVDSDLDPMGVEVGPVVTDSEEEVEDDKMDLDESLNENPTAQVHISEKAKSLVANLRKKCQ